MQRGDIVTVAAPGDYGKPRPAVVIQGDILNQANSRSSIVALNRMLAIVIGLG